MKNSMEVSQKTKKRVAIWSSNPTSEHIYGENYNLKRHMHLSVHSSTYNSQDMEALKCLSTDECIKIMWYIYIYTHTHRIFSSFQSLIRIQLFASPWAAARQASLSNTNSLEPTQTYVHWVTDAIQPSHPLLSPSPPAFNLSQHQGLFKWVSSLHEVAEVLEFQLQHQSFQWTPRTDLL